MQNFIADVKETAKAFATVREARARGLEPKIRVTVKMPAINRSPAFYETPEGCMFANKDKALHDAVWEVYKGMPYEDKRTLCFSPEPDRYLLRVQLWERELEPALPPRQYHKAMGAILHQYVRIKMYQASRDKAKVRMCQPA